MPTIKRKTASPAGAPAGKWRTGQQPASRPAAKPGRPSRTEDGFDRRVLRIAGVSLAAFFVLMFTVAANAGSLPAISGAGAVVGSEPERVATGVNGKLRSKRSLFDEYKDPSSAFGDMRVINILVFGLDKDSGEDGAFPAYSPATVMLVTADYENQTIQVTSIPRDTRTFINRTTVKDKISSCFSYAKGSGAKAKFQDGVSVLKSTVEDMMGVRVDHYAGVDIDGLCALVDALGGVETDVAVDVTVKGEKLVPKGVRVLTGEQFALYAKYTDYADADIGRVRAQQQLAKDLFRTATAPVNLMRLPYIVNLAHEAVYTDLDDGMLTTLGFTLSEFEFTSVKSGTLPGSFGNLGGVNYWIISQDRLVSYVKDTYNITIAARPQDPTSDKLTGLSASLVPSAIQVGQTAQITITGTHADGQTREHKLSSCQVTFSDKTVAKVSGSGFVGLAPGSTLITITKDGVVCRVTLTVVY